MEKLQYFEGPSIGAAVAVAEQNGRQWTISQELGIDEQGILNVPEDMQPEGFYLLLYFSAQSRIVIAQRNLTRHHGDYRDLKREHLENVLGNDWVMVSFDLPIPVERQGERVWTAWKGRPVWKKPAGLVGNKIDCWLLDEEGHVDLFQVGIITHNDGITWHLLGEYRWRGKLFRANGAIVGKPKKPVWGAFGVRKEILEHPEFRDYLRKIRLASWKGTKKELDPPLDLIPEGNYARVQWYSSFAGQTGQGPVELHNGSPAWVHGADIFSSPDRDGIHRLQRNDLLCYSGTTNFGSQEKAIRLLCVEKVQT